MKITATDLKETDQVAALLLKIDTNDVRFFEEVLEEIHRHQPFVLSCMLGYQYVFSLKGFGRKPYGQHVCFVLMSSQY